MINIMNQAFFIHPLPSHIAKDFDTVSGAQPHMIYKRSLQDIIGQQCDVKGK